MNRLAALTIGLVLGCAVPASAGPIFIESGDAGSLVATANDTTGSGVLSTIFGNLFAPDPFDSAFDVDLYKIFIADPLSFSASTVNSPGLNVSDPQLFLFDSNGIGVYMNDDDESGLNGSQSNLPAGHAFGPASAGSYYLAIGWWNNEPLDALLNPIFEDVNGFGVNGPAAGSGALEAWDNNVLQRPDLETAYEIRLTGVGSAEAVVPEPATLVLLATGLAGVAHRRLRKTRRPLP